MALKAKQIVDTVVTAMGQAILAIRTALDARIDDITKKVEDVRKELLGEVERTRQAGSPASLRVEVDTGELRAVLASIQGQVESAVASAKASVDDELCALRKQCETRDAEVLQLREQLAILLARPGDELLKQLTERHLDLTKGLHQQMNQEVTLLIGNVNQDMSTLRATVEILSRAQQPSIEEVAQAAAALIPAPKDGKDVDMQVWDTLVAQLVRGITEKTDAAQAELRREVDAVRELITYRLEKLPDLNLDAVAQAAATLIPAPKDGKDVDMQVWDTLVQQLVERFIENTRVTRAQMSDELAGFRTEVAERFAALPTQEGLLREVLARIPQRDAVDSAMLQTALDSVSESFSQRVRALADTVERMPTIEDVASRAATLIPVPKDGRPGKDGTSVSVEEVSAIMAGMVREMPVPTAESVADVLRDRIAALEAEWALNFERRAQDQLQRAVDRIPVPQPGRDGRDAFPVDSVAFKLLDDGRTLRIVLGAGEARAERDIVLPIVVYRNYYKAEQWYDANDAVTFGGSLWIANVRTNSRPETDDTWRLAVKRGRDGAPGKKGEPGEKGVPGDKAVLPNPFDPLGKKGGV
jgi:hypothetical protein